MSELPGRLKVHYEVFGAAGCDIVHHVTYRDRLGLITANATTPYIQNFFDLSETGPLVIELPAGPTAGGLSDFWQREIGVMGEMGPDQGKGGRCPIDNDQQRGDRGSRDPDLAYNDDGSVDLYFGPHEPEGHGSNWIQTLPGQHWFSYFRFYGPLESYFDRSWKLGDIVAV
ncbi:uncharacterized protein DUF1254 [Williamsia limnetica]|uniref:Uncharacterized protein DUF1254 n=1 Tax=Williamsia limnetica TaxID=882452 RepID=A0A318RNJ1_WILLI|nr:DUF1214 domain-containing protein [Williamsia limnetica]PYE17489.1 uncharacterized protein DUF1254 [Williamsia limnetica]